MTSTMSNNANAHTVCAATSVMVVSNGVSGKKLMFMYPFNNKETSGANCDQPSSYYSHPRLKNKPVLANNTSHLNEVMTEFGLSTDTLGEILTVHNGCLEQPFDLKVDNNRFVAFPKGWENRTKQLSIVFSIRHTAEQHSVEAYQRLSRSLAIAYVTLQNIDGHLEDELKIMEECDDQDLQFSKVREKSKMAKTLMEMFDDVTRTGNVHKYINDFVEVTFCDEALSLAKNGVMPKGRDEIYRIAKMVRPYHGILLLEDVLPTPDANPAVSKLLQVCSPDRSIIDMSTAADLPISQVFLMVVHLLVWTRSILIYPMCSTNVYTSATSPQPLETMIKEFAKQFGANIHLAAGLAHFNPPASLGSFIRSNLPLSEQQVRGKLVKALLRHQMLMQLHQFCYILKPYSCAELPKPQRNCPDDLVKLIQKSCIELDVQPVVADICSELLEKESYAQVEEKLTLFISLVPLMNGNHHLEDMKYRKNLEREVIEDVLNAFQLVIAKFLRPDFVSE